MKFTEEGEVKVNAQASREGVEIRAEDTGIGIPKDALSSIFEPFRQLESTSTRRFNGTGLGLHIVKRLLDLVGGQVAVESEVGRGSTFCVWVPTEHNKIGQNDTQDTDVPHTQHHR